MHLNDPAYPLPEPTEGMAPPADSKVANHVDQLLDHLPALLNSGISSDPIAEWSKEQYGSEYLEVVEGAFVLLMSTLRERWGELDRPLAALENLVIDFRSAPSASARPKNLLQEVAGISEYDGEDEKERESRRDRVYQIVFAS